MKLLLSDSTNVEREGFALTEREIRTSFKDIFAEAKGRILITLFSSHIQRMQEVMDLAVAQGRKVAVSGRSLSRNVEMAVEMGCLKAPSGTLLSVDEITDLPDDQVVLLVTGSQGEPLAALSRLAMGEHRRLSIRKGDLVIMSSRFIPGKRQGHHPGHQQSVPPGRRGSLREGPGHPRLGARPPRGAADHAGKPWPRSISFRCTENTATWSSTPAWPWKPAWTGTRPWSSRTATP